MSSICKVFRSNGSRITPCGGDAHKGFLFQIRVFFVLQLTHFEDCQVWTTGEFEEDGVGEKKWDTWSSVCSG